MLFIPIAPGLFQRRTPFSNLVGKVSGGNEILTTTPAEGVSLVVALSEAGGTLRYIRRQSLKVLSRHRTSWRDIGFGRTHLELGTVINGR